MLYNWFSWTTSDYIEAVKDNPMFLAVLPQTQRNDPDLVAQALKLDMDCWKYAGNEIRGGYTSPENFMDEHCPSFQDDIKG